MRTVSNYWVKEGTDSVKECSIIKIRNMEKNYPTEHLELAFRPKFSARSAAESTQPQSSQTYITQPQTQRDQTFGGEAPSRALSKRIEKETKTECPSSRGGRVKRVSKKRPSMPFHPYTLLKHCASASVTPQNRLKKDSNGLKSIQATPQKDRKYEQVNRKLAQTLKVVSGTSTPVQPVHPSARKATQTHIISQDYSQVDARELTEELFREANRKIKADGERKVMRQEKQNCQYRQMKKQLNKQLNAAASVEIAMPLQAMIKGCEAAIHTRSSAKNGPSEKVLRLKTLTRTGIAINLAECGEKKRPKSARNAMYSRQEVDFIKEQHRRFDEHDRERPKTCRAIRSNTTKKTARFEEPTLTQLYRGEQRLLSARKGSKKGRSTIQKSMSEIEGLLGQCSQHAGDFEVVTEGMSTFREYCRRMDNHLSRLGEKLTSLKNAPIDMEYIF